jgi:hypothetical protein
MDDQFLHPFPHMVPDWLATGHLLSLFHTTRQHVASSQKLPSAGRLWILVNMWTSSSSLHATIIKWGLVHTQMSPSSNFIFFYCSSCNMPFQLAFFFVRSPNKIVEEKKLSIYNLWHRPSAFLLSSVCVALTSCTLRCFPFSKYTFMPYV